MGCPRVTPRSTRATARHTPVSCPGLSRACNKRRGGPRQGTQIMPTVFSRACGWISDWLITTVCGRKRSTMVRT